MVIFIDLQQTSWLPFLWHSIPHIAIYSFEDKLNCNAAATTFLNGNNILRFHLEIFETLQNAILINIIGLIWQMQISWHIVLFVTLNFILNVCYVFLDVLCIKHNLLSPIILSDSEPEQVLVVFSSSSIQSFWNISVFN